MSTALSLAKRLTIFAAISMPVLLTGCANMVPTASDTNAFSVAGTMVGKIHGGNQPVSNSTVKLYAVGTGGYGSAGTLLATTTSAADSSFSFSQVTTGATGPAGSAYICPTSNTLTYIIASGGNTLGSGSNNNAAAVFLAAVGPCAASANAFLNLNEVSTAAAVAALAQYINPGTTTPGSTSIGSPNTTQAKVGIANGFATVPNLINVAAGSALTTGTLNGTNSTVTGVVVTATPEAAKINTIANILSACANNASVPAANCTTLFNSATPPSPALTSQPTATFTTAVDTLQANYYMATNPTDGSAANLLALYNLAAGAGAPFQTALSSAPTDWTVGIKYSSSSSCSTGKFLAAAYHPAVDAGGNIWIAGASTTGDLMEIGPNGTPLVCTVSAIGSGSHSVVLDTAGNVWIAGGVGITNVYEYNPTTGVTTPWPVLGTAPIFVLAADGNGNIFYSIGTSLYEFVNAANATIPTTAVLIGTIGSTPNFLAADTVGRIWSTGSTTTGSLFDTYPSAGAGNTNGYLTVSTTANYTNGFGLTIGVNNTAYVGNSNNGGSAFSNTLSYYTDGGGVITPVGVTAQYTGGMSGPREAATDGAGNVWSVNSTAAGGNYVTGATTSGLFAVTEYSAAGAAISPTGTSTTTAINGGFQKDLTILPAAGRGIAVDPTGNVWIGLNSAGAASTSITEIVGAAVPVVTPIPAALIAGAAGGNAVSKP